MLTNEIHIPLPDDLVAGLKAESLRSGKTEIEIVKEAIRLLIAQGHREVIGQEIEAYAAAVAGTDQDLPVF
jgi:hypothetical protein